MNKENLNELALFAGAGGGILGGHLLGWRTVCAVEWEPYPASVLCARQNDGLLPPFPIWDDVCSFDGKPWRGIVDVISGGFPCQDISAAGKGAGIDGERSGMWREMARIIHEVRPRFVFVENSPMLTSRGLGAVLGDLATMGFNAKWGVLGANDIGANHQRDRIWIRAELANANSNRLHGSKTEWDRESEWSICKNQSDNRSEIWSEIDRCSESGSEEKISNPQAIGLQGSWQHEQSLHPKKSRQGKADGLIYGRSPEFWAIEPNVGRVAHGVASRVDRIKAIGNGQVPLCAATAWRILK
jgi:DNA (cytosine-5)-methyltransferase 1